MNKGGFEDYARAIRNDLFREAFRLCGNRHDADDLTQITLYKVYRQWERLSRQGSLAAYSRRALLRTYLSDRRRHRWTCEVSQAELPELPTAASSIEDRIMLTTAVSRLARHQRSVIALRFWADLTVEQTATMLGCTPGTVTSQTHRALVTLRAMLAVD